MAAPLMLVIALSGLIQRKDNDRLQVLPALFVGSGLIISAALARKNRRKKLLDSLRQSKTVDI
tara:strand:- start:610 stop:798 length:189 start_codon:yes stop_codon:yes gene_type:complete